MSKKIEEKNKEITKLRTTIAGLIHLAQKASETSIREAAYGYSLISDQFALLAKLYHERAEL